MEANHELVGWDGQIAPAPVEWDIRPYFLDEQLTTTIQNWTTSTTEALKDCSVAQRPSLDLVSGLEIAPQYWAPDKAQLEALGPSWRHFLLLDPQPVDPSDLHSAAPYWWRYVSKDGWLLGPQTQPQERGINASEEGKEAARRRAADHGSTKAMEKYQRRVQAQVQREAFRSAVEAVAVTTPDIIHMKVEVFIRPAAAKDAPQIVDILKSQSRLTYYPTSSQVTVPAVTELISICRREALPFLVAVKRLPHHTEKPSSTIGRRRIVPEDEVYGVAYASSRQPFDLSPTDTTVNQTVKHGCVHDQPAHDDITTSASTPAYLEFYVRSDVCRKGVGSALLDVMLSVLIPVPYYFPSTGHTFAVSPEAVLGWKKSVSEVQIWLRHTGAETDTDTMRVLAWLKSPRWGFEGLDDVMPGPADKEASRVARLRRRCTE